MLDYYTTLTPNDQPGIRPALSKYEKARNDVPLVSVVTSYFNTGKIFRETVRSVLRQSLQQFEFLIIDDHSSPEHRPFLTDIANSDNRIRLLFHEKNMGPSAARNKGIDAALSNYILLLDSDDTVEPAFMEKLYWLLLTRTDLALANGHTIEFADEIYINPNGFNSHKRFLTRNPIATLAVMFHKKRIQGCRFNENRRLGLEDWEFWLDCLGKGLAGTTIPEISGWNRRKADQLKRWPDLHDDSIPQFLDEIRARNSILWEGNFPAPAPPEFPFGEIPLESPASNPLANHGEATLLLTDRLTPRTESLLGLLAAYNAGENNASCIALAQGSHPSQQHFQEITDDIFCASNFLLPQDRPRFLTYFIESRSPSKIIVQGYDALRFVPFLRTTAPNIPIHHIALDDLEQKKALPMKPFMSMILLADMPPMPFPVKHLPNAEDRIDFRKGLCLPQDLPVLLHFLHPEARFEQDVLIRALHKLEQREASYGALLVGNSAGLPAITNYINEHGMTRAYVQGNRHPWEGIRYMRASDIFLCPGSALESVAPLSRAAACGLAILGADEPLLRKHFNQAALLVDINTDINHAAEECANKLEPLIRDSEVLKRHAKAAASGIYNNSLVQKTATLELVPFDDAQSPDPRLLQHLALSATETR